MAGNPDDRIVGKSGCTVAQAKARFSTEHYNPIRAKAEMEHLRRTLAGVCPPKPDQRLDGTDWRCSTCEETGRRGYCARGRCYCGHPACHAYDTWIDLRRPNQTTERK
jgi:hypothetical protein